MKVSELSVSVSVTLRIFLTVHMITLASSRAESVTFTNVGSHNGFKRSLVPFISFHEEKAPENDEASFRSKRNLVENNGHGFPKGHSSRHGRNHPKTWAYAKDQKFQGRIIPRGRDVFNWNINTKGSGKDDSDEEEDKVKDEKVKDKPKDKQSKKGSKGQGIKTGLVGDGAEVAVGANVEDSELAKSTATEIEDFWSDIYDNEDNANLAAMSETYPFLKKMLQSSNQTKASGLSLIGPVTIGTTSTTKKPNLPTTTKKPVLTGKNPTKKPILTTTKKPIPTTTEKSSNGTPMQLVAINVPVKPEGNDKGMVPGNPDVHVVYRNGKAFLFVGVLIPL